MVEGCLRSLSQALALAICHWWRAPLQDAIEADAWEGGRLEAAIAAAVEQERSGGSLTAGLGNRERSDP